MDDIARLRWLCRRGMKELDVVLSRYLEQDYAAAPLQDQQQFRSLLEMPDPELYRLLLGRDPVENRDTARLLEKLRFNSGTP